MRRIDVAKSVAPEITDSRELSPSLTRMIHLHAGTRAEVSVDSSRPGVDVLCSHLGHKLHLQRLERIPWWCDCACEGGDSAASAEGRPEVIRGGIRLTDVDDKSASVICRSCAGRTSDTG